LIYKSSFRDAPLGAGPESIAPVVMLIRGDGWRRTAALGLWIPGSR
jgi:hypothetical protein